VNFNLRVSSIIFSVEQRWKFEFSISQMNLLFRNIADSII